MDITLTSITLSSVQPKIHLMWLMDSGRRSPKITSQAELPRWYRPYCLFEAATRASGGVLPQAWSRNEMLLRLPPISVITACDERSESKRGLC